MRYIVKNCPAIYGIDDGFLCSYGEDEDEKYCYDCTDCFIKQVIEKCKDKIRIYEWYDRDYALGKANCAKSILRLFDIEDVQ